MVKGSFINDVMQEGGGEVSTLVTISIKLPKHGGSDGKAGDTRLKDPGFNPRLDPMRLCFKINGVFVSYIHG